jgi:cytochrome c oxidase subunit 1
VFNVMSSLGASILAVGYLLPACYLGWSLIKGKAAGANPWNVKSVEWEIASPPITENFRKVPILDQEPYNYAPGAGH